MLLFPSRRASNDASTSKDAWCRDSSICNPLPRLVNEQNRYLLLLDPLVYTVFHTWSIHVQLVVVVPTPTNSTADNCTFSLGLATRQSSPSPAFVHLQLVAYSFFLTNRSPAPLHMSSCTDAVLKKDLSDCSSFKPSRTPARDYVTQQPTIYTLKFVSISTYFHYQNGSISNSS